ncbi:MAG: transposase, partial [Gammaproteobacteria bacterium]|nr:transposase [Gammaproteobacteria bacterium]
MFLIYFELIKIDTYFALREFCAFGTLIRGFAPPLKCALYLHKDPKKGRTRKNKNGSLKKTDVNHDYARSYKEPWLLASYLPKTFNVAKKVVVLYKKRMQIEETFRDL